MPERGFMRVSLRNSAVLSALLLTVAAAPGPGTSVCRASGWGVGPQVDVRAAPSPSGRVLARLVPRAAEQDGVDLNGALPEFRIHGARGGWFLIGEASFGDYGDPKPRRPLYAGQGWVRGDQIGGQLMPGRLYSAPTQRSRSRAYGKGTDEVEVKRLLDCTGTWVKIEADIGTGWVNGLCSNQVTTCS